MDEKEVTGIKIWQIILPFLIILIVVAGILYLNKPKKTVKKDINKDYNSPKAIPVFST